MKTENKPLMTEDSGIVVYDVDTNEYYCGLNTFSTQLRKSCIYHKQTFVNEVIKKYPQRNLKTCNITMSVMKKK